MRERVMKDAGAGGRRRKTNMAMARARVADDGHNLVGRGVVEKLKLRELRDLAWAREKTRRV